MSIDAIKARAKSIAGDSLMLAVHGKFIGFVEEGLDVVPFLLYAYAMGTCF